MSANIRYPHITGKTEKEQLAQLRGYLKQLVDDLNYILPAIEESANKAHKELEDEIKKLQAQNEKS